MEALIKLDEVAYIRYASVYRRFRDAGQFMNEVERLIGRGMKVKPCSSMEIWQSSLSDILKSIEGISLNEVADISAGISMFCSENNSLL